MGRTVPTYRDALEGHLAQWEREFGRSLNDPADRESFRRVQQRARRYVAQGTMMATGDLVERVFLSILVSLERELYDRAKNPRLPVPESEDPFVVELRRSRPQRRLPALE
ncbi:MAG: hypothetical protein L3K18_07535 [Thermoplasmata archaeon]|jgi:hypothetical protein|nr:hypothetical protein [Thermoplasmata archaeon]MCI4356974.1 hypothetical protein [Thermoplasmata archaeon]